MGTTTNEKLDQPCTSPEDIILLLGSIGGGAGSKRGLELGHSLCETLRGYCLGLRQSAQPTPVNLASINFNGRLFWSICLSPRKLNLILQRKLFAGCNQPKPAASAYIGDYIWGLWQTLSGLVLKQGLHSSHWIPDSVTPSRRATNPVLLTQVSLSDQAENLWKEM